jgi:hypothetical protein
MALEVITGSTGAIKVFATDYRIFIRALNKIDSQQSKELIKSYKKIGADVKDSVTKEIKELGTSGPMSGMRHGGRTGWGRNYGRTGGPVSTAKRYPYNSILVQAYVRPKKGQTGIARLVVRSSGTVLGDLARFSRGTGKTRPYQIRLFGGPEITRTHTKTQSGTNAFITNLGGITKTSNRGKSRNVYPGFDKALPEAKKEAELAVQRAVNFIANNIDRTPR